MKRALMTSKNLLGDGLYISRALSQWHRENPDYSIDLLTNSDYITPIYTRMGVPLRVLVEDNGMYKPLDYDYGVVSPYAADHGHYDFQFTFDPSSAFSVCDRDKCHITEGYAKLLGVRLPELPRRKHLKPIFIPTPEVVKPNEKGLVLISMFSASCSSRKGGPPNKMLPWAKWRPILRYLRTRFGQDSLRFLGAPDDRAPELDISEEEYMTGIPLNRLALIMAESKLVLTLDNGMSHLAASQEAKEIVLYPAVLGLHYIAPIGNPNCGVLQMDPNTVDPSSIITAIKMFVKDMGL